MENVNYEVVAQEGLTYAQAVAVRAQAFIIDSPEQAETINDILRKVKGKAKDIETRRTEIVGPINDSVKRINDLFRQPLKVLADVERVIKDKLLVYDQAQRRIREKKEAAVKAEAIKNAKDEEDRLLQAAEKALDHHDLDTAGKMLGKAVDLVPVVPKVAPAPKPKGFYVVVEWDFEIVDFNEVPDRFWVVDLVALRKAVESEGENCKIPGIKVLRREIPKQR